MNQAMVVTLKPLHGKQFSLAASRASRHRFKNRWYPCLSGSTTVTFNGLDICDPQSKSISTGETATSSPWFGATAGRGSAAG